MFLLATRIAAALELGLVILHDLSPPLGHSLPLAGSHAAQVGIIFATVFVGAEIVEFVRFSLKHFRGWLRSTLKRYRASAKTTATRQRSPKSNRNSDIL